MMEEHELKFAVEAILFASERPLTAEQIKTAFDEPVEITKIKEALGELKADYETQSRGFRLIEIAGGAQLVSDERFAPYLKRFYESRERKKLSQASLETLSIVAYSQPVTRADIEAIRGVNVDGPVKLLLEKEMIKIVGRKDVMGKPMLYGTTQEFLEIFGLKSLADLPKLSEYTEKDIESHLLPPELKQPVELSNPDEKEEVTS